MNLQQQERDCIHCGTCTSRCEFLNKYQLDLGDIAGLSKQLYHCFLCGDCKVQCPKQIDGREIILNLRQKEVEKNHGTIQERGYDMLIKEKSDYIFRNYKHVTSGSVLFPGCNFPSFYPKTTKMLMQLLKEKAGIGTIFDCCGKPISELGLKKEEERIINELNDRLESKGVQEIIMLCPNCYYFLQPRLKVKVISIFEVLHRLQLGNKIESQEINIFTPCPDKAQKLWQKEMNMYLPNTVNQIEGVACCGLGGCARAKEPEISKGFSDEIRKRNYTNVYTYCASCAGKLTRDGCESVHHVLVDILGMQEEKPDIQKSMINRAKTKFW
ncbi:MAG: (Fe-S)-binding protein [Lachnospiraceae bacterium]